MPLGRDRGGFDRTIIHDPPTGAAVGANAALFVVIVAYPVGADEMAFEACQEPGAEMHAWTYRRAVAAGLLWDYPQDFVVSGAKTYKMCFSARVDRHTVIP
jgi:hypothetical protein